MIRQIRRYFAIRDYALRFAPELVKRWGTQRFYTLDQVTQASLASGFGKDFVAYAHAIFSSRADFDAYYRPLRLRCSYDGLRAVVGRRYFGGVTDFDAASIIRAGHRVKDNDFNESGLGDDVGH
jgi:hypothetical protein